MPENTFGGFGRAHIPRLIRQYVCGIPRFQGLRELLQNCLEAFATIVDIIPWVDETGAVKLAFLDDGNGMSAEQLAFVPDLAWSGEGKHDTDNFGLGAKLANLGWNETIIYISRREGRTHKMTLSFDPIEGIKYHVEPMLNSFWWESQIKNLPGARSIAKNGHGTLVILNGTSEEPNSFSSWATPVSGDKDAPKWNPSRTLPEYLNNKYLKIGDNNCRVTYWWQLPQDGDEKSRPSKRLVKGLEGSLESLRKIGDISTYTVDVPGCQFSVYYGDCFPGSDGKIRGLNPAAQHNGVFGGRSGDCGSGGMVAVVYKNEVYGEIRSGNKASTSLKQMGFWVPAVHKNLIVIIRPDETKCRPNQSRTGLDWHGGPYPTALPIDQMQEAFRANLPTELQDILSKVGAFRDCPDLHEELREYALELKSFQSEYGEGTGDGDGGGPGGVGPGGGGPGTETETGPGRGSSSSSDRSSDRNQRPNDTMTGDQGTRKRVRIDSIPRVVVEFDLDAAYQCGDYSIRAGTHVIHINQKCQEIQRIVHEQIQRRPRVSEETVREITEERIRYAIATKILETLMVLPEGVNPIEEIDDFFIGGLMRGADMKEGVFVFVSRQLTKNGAALR